MHAQGNDEEEEDEEIVLNMYLKVIYRKFVHPYSAIPLETKWVGPWKRPLPSKSWS